MLASFAPMFILGLMVDLRALVLSFLRAPMMLVMPFSSSMAMIGKADCWRYERTAMPLGAAGAGVAWPLLAGEATVVE